MNEQPDRYCVTLPDGECVSTDPRDMHRPKPKGHTVACLDAENAQPHSTFCVCWCHKHYGS